MNFEEEKYDIYMSMLVNEISHAIEHLNTNQLTVSGVMNQSMANALRSHFGTTKLVFGQTDVCACKH
jgi:hypothetical protein